MHILPSKFSDAERRAYQWLYDCQVRGWTVDLLTRQVRCDGVAHENLVTFAESHGMQTTRAMEGA